MGEGVESVVFRAASSRLAANVPVPDDCRSCGVCCFSPTENYVRVTGADWERFGEAADRLAHFIGHRAFMRMTEGHCVALEVHAAANGARKFLCGIYERRPQVCRDLSRGSPECAGELARKGSSGPQTP